MSIINEIQEVGLGQLLRRRLGILATGSPAPALAPELMPIIALESDRAEFSYPKGERRVLGWAQRGADAAAYSGAGIYNPVGSGQIVVLEQLVTTSLTVANIYRTTGPIAGSLARTDVSDLRWPSPGPNFNAVHQAVDLVAVGLPPSGEIRRTNSVGVVVHDVPFVLPPGTGLLILNAVINNALTVYWHGYERAVVAGELL